METLAVGGYALGLIQQEIANTAVGKHALDACNKAYIIQYWT